MTRSPLSPKPPNLSERSAGIGDPWGRVLTVLYRHPRLVVTTLLVSLAASLFGILKLQIESDTRIFLPPDDPQYQIEQTIKQRYGLESEILIGYHPENGLITQPKVAAAVADIGRRVQTIGRPGSPLGNPAEADGSESPVETVQSIATLQFASRTDSGIVPLPTADLLPHPPTEETYLQTLLTGSDLYRNILYSGDLRYGAIIVTPRNGLNGGQQTALLNEIRKILSEYQTRSPELRFFLTGESVSQSVIGESILNDLLWLIPLLGIVICGTFLVYFRSAAALVIILFPVLYALLLTLSLMGWLQVKLTFIHATMPIITMALGSADAIHTLIHYLQTPKSPRETLSKLLHTQKVLIRPITLTSLTTGIGFLALSSSPMPPVRSFGFFCAIAIGLAWLTNLFLTPLLIGWFSSRLRPLPEKAQHRIGQICYTLVQKLLRHPARTKISLGLAVTALALSIFYLRVDNNPIDYFRKNAEISTATETINRELNGIYTVHLNLHHPTPGTLLRPAALRFLEGLKRTLERAHPEVITRIIGLPSFLKNINQVINSGDRDSYYEIPSEISRYPVSAERLKNLAEAEQLSPEDAEEEALRRLILRYLSFYQQSLENFVSPSIADITDTRLVLFLKSANSESINAVLKSIDGYQRTHLSPAYELSQSGYALQVDSMNQLVVKGQLSSILIALTGVFLLTLCLFRSFLYALLACLPPLIAFLSNFALMAALGIDLNIGTAMIVSLIIGVGIDYSIHFLNLFQKNRNRMDRPEAVQKTLQQTGESICLNASSVSLGYAVLLASGLRGLNYFGGLSAFASLLTTFLTLLLVPFLLLAPKTTSSSPKIRNSVKR